MTAEQKATLWDLLLHCKTIYLYLQKQDTDEARSLKKDLGKNLVRVTSRFFIRD